MAPRLVRTLFLVALAGGLVATGMPAASAQDAFDEQISAAQAEVYSAQQAAHEVAARVEAAQQQRAAIEAKVLEVQAHVAEIEAQIPVLKAEVDRLRTVLRERAAILYRTTGPWSKESALPLNPSLKAVRQQHLADAVAKADDAMKEQLEAAGKVLAKMKDELAVEQQVLAAQQAELAQVEADLAAQQGELDRRVAAANAALERARALGALRARGEPVMGPTILSGAQMAAWWHTRGYSFRVSGTIEELAQIFVEEGSAENVRGDLAFAQSIVETGGFRASPANNFAGLGWCDSCSDGRGFPTPRDGVRAQIQHLKNYADSTSRASGLAYPPSPYWYGSDPARAIRNFDTFFAKGWAPTWSDMGRGNWATDKAYSGKVLQVYADMVAFAQGRSAG